MEMRVSQPSEMVENPTNTRTERQPKDGWLRVVRLLGRNHVGQARLGLFHRKVFTSFSPFGMCAYMLLHPELAPVPESMQSRAACTSFTTSFFTVRR